MAGTPAAALAFARAIGADGLVRLAHPVSAALLDGNQQSRGALAEVSRVMAVAAAADPLVAAGVVRTLRTADPHVAALVLADGRFPPTVVGAVAPHLLAAEATRPVVLVPRGPTVGALLAQALARLPDLARTLLPTRTPAELVTLLEGPFGSGAAAGGRLLAAAADPTSGPLAAVAAFTAWLVAQLHARPALIRGPVGGHLGAALAPWIVDLAPVDRHAFPSFPAPRIDPASGGAEVLRRVAAQPGSAAVLTAAADDLLRAELGAAATDPAYEERIQPYAVLSASLDAWAVEGARDAADRTYGAWRATVNVIGELLGMAAGLVPKAGMVLERLAPAATQRVAHLLAHPPDPRANERLADEARWARETSARDAAVTGLFAGAVAAGALPAGTPPPPRTGAAVLSRCGTGCDPAAAGADGPRARRPRARALGARRCRSRGAGGPPGAARAGGCLPPCLRHAGGRRAVSGPPGATAGGVSRRPAGVW
jgi:hypothetical protein